MPLNPLLRGVRVLDLSQHVPGPFCTDYLAQMGAEVIKIEPESGDPMRQMSPEVFALINRNKRSVTLDLRNAQQRESFLQLVRSADVVVESFRPGVMEKLGCSYPVLRQINPKLVYAALTGYGQTGPYREWAGHDLNFRAYSGELEQSGPAGGAPTPGNFPVAGLAGGALTCAIGILAALYGAASSGEGSLVDVSMLDSTLALQLFPLAALRSYGRSLPRGEDLSSGLLPNFTTYECADGKYLAVGALEPAFFAQMCKTMERPDLARRPPIPGNAGVELRRELAAAFKTRSRDEWAALLCGPSTCISPVLTIEEALENEQVKSRDLIQLLAGKPSVALPIQFSNGLRRCGEVPALGADNQLLLGAVVSA